MFELMLKKFSEFCAFSAFAFQMVEVDNEGSFLTFPTAWILS